MSHHDKNPEKPCDIAEGCGAIELIIRPRDTDLGGFSVRRALPTRERKMVGPWIFFDHMGPAEFPAGSGISVSPHPHINLATVTYLFEGEMLHRDSLGSLQAIVPGDLNLMIAGSGIVHSERERPEVTEVDHRLHGLQLWLALPETDEEVDAEFLHYPSYAIPAVDVDGVPVRVLMGDAFAVKSPVKTFANTLYVEAHLQAGQCLTLPNAEERAIYVAAGRLSCGETEFDSHSMAVFTAEEGVVVKALEESRIALIGGDNIGPRYIEWNFVSSRKDRIEQAKQDWREQRFAKVPGDEEEYIPLPK